MIRLVLSARAEQELTEHFRQSGKNETGAFCLVREGAGARGSRRLLVTEVLPSENSAWEERGQDVLRPSAQWISATVSRAVNSSAGLVFVHSHPGSHHPPGLSRMDLSSFEALARALSPALDGPFCAAVVHASGWAAVLWDGARVVPIERIQRSGKTLRFLSPVSTLPSSPLDSRQSDALGLVHDCLRAITIGIVGCGGLGSPIAEQLVRMGVMRVILIDYDLLDTDSNVRRVFGARLEDLADSPPKVFVIQRHLDSIGLEVEIVPVYGDVRREDVFRELLEADVVLCATDNHGSRAVINELPSKYLLPVIDVGVRVGAKKGGQLAGLLAEVRVLTPSTPCLWCRKAISSDVIRAENLPFIERNKLRREGYIVGGVGEPVASVIALTVLGAGLGTSAMLALLAEEGEITPSGYWVDGLLGDSGLTSPDVPNPACRCQQGQGLGDVGPIPFMS